MKISGSARRGLAAGAVAAVAVGVTMQASFALPSTTSPYIIDGTILTQTEPEKSSTIFDDASGSAPELGPINASSTKLGVIHSAPKPMLGTTNPNAQVDLKNVWLDTAADSTGDIWLYLAWQRDSNKGSGVIMYEFQQGEKPVACDYSKINTPTEADLIAACNPFEKRQPGDFILVWDQQGGSTAIGIRTWGYTDVNGNGVYNAGIDTLTLGATVTTASDDAEAKYSSDKFFGEATVNLSDTIFPPTPTSCFTVGNIIPGTVTGNSDTADYKDVVLKDFAESLTISNCGSVEITKDTNPEGGTGQFGYTLARSGGALLDYADPPKTSRTGTLTEDGDSETQLNLRTGTNYTLAENIGAGTPYDLSSIVCTLGSSSYTVTTAGANFPVAAGQTTSCLITNQLKTGTLHVTKVLTNDNGGTRAITGFSFTATGQAGGSAIPFEADGTNSFTVNAGTYAVAEVGVPIAGYSTTYGSNCPAVQVPAGGEATCVITNNDQSASLTLVKEVTKDNGGTAVAADWTLSADGPTDISGTSGSPAVTSVAVDAGTYNLSESGGPAGYTASGWVCVGGTMPAGDTDTVNLGLGQSATCTITNDDQAGTLIVNKVVTNNNGGTLGPDDFSFSVNGGTAVAFDEDGQNSLSVPAGVYDVEETPPAGYTMTGNTCVDVVVPNGGSASCTITNDDQAATLIVNKVVTNDNGGTLGPDDFSFSVNGGTAVAFEADGQNSLGVPAGVYDVDETPPAGYTMTGNTCVDVVIANGETKECTITNDDTKASPSGTTTQRWVLHDTLGVVGLRAGAEDAADADATFRLYADAQCATLVGSEVVGVSGSAASTVEGIGVDDPGDYFWRVQYSGDQFNNGFTTACGDEVTQIYVKDHLRNNLVAGP